MAYPYSTIQTGSSVIGSATGDSIVLDPGAGDRFGIGAIVVIWPSGQSLDRNISNYEMVQIADRIGDTLTVTSPGSDSRSGFDTWSVGDQLGLSFPDGGWMPWASPSGNILTKNQTQVVTVGKTDGFGSAIDLGADVLGIVGLITATISDVNLDGGTPGEFEIDITIDSSFDGINWRIPNSGKISTAGNSNYFPWAYSTDPGFSGGQLFIFQSATEPEPLLGHAVVPRYIRFQHKWTLPVDLGVAASATITFKLEYF